MVLCYVPWSNGWKVLPSWETLQQADCDIRYLNDALGLPCSGQEIWAPRFLPHWSRGTFPHSLTISLVGLFPLARCDSPLQLFVTATWSIALQSHTAALKCIILRVCQFRIYEHMCCFMLSLIHIWLSPTRIRTSFLNTCLNSARPVGYRQVPSGLVRVSIL